MGENGTGIKFLLNMLSQHGDFGDALHYVKEYANGLGKFWKNWPKLGGTEGEGEDYSPVTREKLNNPNEDVNIFILPWIGNVFPIG